MTMREVLLQAYHWAVSERLVVLVTAVVLPALGTLVARIGKGGKTDADGRFIASAVVGIAMLAVVIEAGALLIASTLFGRTVLDADALLVLSPVLCLGGCLVGIRWVFPLNELASVRTAVDVGLFVLACAALLWLLSMFRGWGIVFFGGVSQLVAVGLLAAVLLRRLYRRALGRRETAGTALARQ